ncbi:hypothetical protein K1719_024364 [Acacia pycnantha]|nr:hypothetical protein K1719_024364 [Acacia pycnantha]
MTKLQETLRDRKSHRCGAPFTVPIFFSSDGSWTELRDWKSGSRHQSLSCSLFEPDATLRTATDGEKLSSFPTIFTAVVPPPNAVVASAVSILLFVVWGE